VGTACLQGKQVDPLRVDGALRVYTDFIDLHAEMQALQDLGVAFSCNTPRTLESKRTTS
jgi:hypothetical protein